MQDTRNVTDEFKNVSEMEIIDKLDKDDHGLIIALENTERDFNMGTIVRSANAFGVRRVIIIGRRQWNKRGAMMTDKYLHVHYYATVSEFMKAIDGKVLIAIDNVEGSVPLHQAQMPADSVLLFGAEGPGISEELLRSASRIVAIEQLGSTRSVNVGVAAGIDMYVWLQQHHLS